ncbi:hypothetical protein C0Q70_01609 [Pomacea canaliculata]|uniref:Uncharacterized protein n=1 Tax=Pomacea canaliculata TaxID=400727 RepID=A0A2T7PZY8_POMCA|nr:hypothetical protein C0Q70_01609 [Pomacea canaliculata]
MATRALPAVPSPLSAGEQSCACLQVTTPPSLVPPLTSEGSSPKVNAFSTPCFSLTTLTPSVPHPASYPSPARAFSSCPTPPHLTSPLTSPPSLQEAAELGEEVTWCGCVPELVSDSTYVTPAASPQPPSSPFYPPSPPPQTCATCTATGARCLPRLGLRLESPPVFTLSTTSKTNKSVIGRHLLAGARCSDR